MPTLPTIATLWIGPELSWLEQLCLKSFVDAGHEMRLYTYDKVANVPQGVTLCDANDIFPGDNIIRHRRTGSPAIHADIWRLHLMAKTDCIWVDADVLCVKPFDFRDGYVFGLEKKDLVCNAVMRLPTGSQTLAQLLDFVGDVHAIGPWLSAEKQAVLQAAKDAGTPVHFCDQDWGLTGPAAFTHFLKQSGEWAHALPQSAFYPVSFRDRNKMLLPRHQIETEFLDADTRAVHLWARRMKPRLQEAEGNRPRPGSFLYRAVLKHGIDPRLAPIPAKKTAAPATAEGDDDAAPMPMVAPPLAQDPASFAAKPATAPAAKPAAAPVAAPSADVILCHGLQVPFDPRIIRPRIEKPLRRGRYSGDACAALRLVLRPGDRVLDLGAGLGLCSAFAATMPGVDRVVAVEANPDLIPVIQETCRLNGLQDRVELRNAVVVDHPEANPPFYIRADFRASSLDGPSRPFSRVAQVPAVGLAQLMQDLRPTVLVCDIAGAELGLFDAVDLSNLRHLILTQHPVVYGPEGLKRIAAALKSNGLHPARDTAPGSPVQRFLRQDAAPAQPDGTPMPAQSARPSPAESPRVLITTCMKDEGPFILEWLAWHRAVGVTDFVVFTNDCSDGTDRILDHLAARGEVQHLPNPALVAGSPAFQPLALAYTQMLPVFRRSDFVISMDVDEFLNIRCGAGRLTDLFQATGPFDALSISELNHGANGRTQFTPGWIRPQFPAHQVEAPGKRRARRGVKTITRLSPLLAKLRNHRPDFRADSAPRWLDGSGRPTDWFHQDASQNGMDVRGSYDLVSLDHYALRSLESFFMKTLRGDVVVANKSVSLRYWRERNRNDATNSTYNPALEAAARAYYDQTYQSDATLMALQAEACAWHRTKIDSIAAEPEFVMRRDWIMANAWDGSGPEVED